MKEKGSAGGGRGEEVPALPGARAQEDARGAQWLVPSAAAPRGSPCDTSTAPAAPCPSHTRPETWDTPDLPREGATCSLGGLLEDLSTISMRFLSFSVLDATHPTGWGEDTVYMHEFTKGV